MSERIWTAPQLDAITARGHSLLVSAAAGSGKTAVLVERAVRMITRQDDPIQADRLLILTFTNAAADELRSRIGAALETELFTQKDNPHLRRQRILLRRAYIGTMDAFCQQLVREHFSALQIPPDITIGDPSLLEQLSQNALAETMEEMYQNDLFAQFATLYGRSRSDREVEKAILSLFDFTRTLPLPDKALQNFVALVEADTPLKDTPWGKELFQYGEEALATCLRILGEAEKIIDSEPSVLPYGATIAAYRDGVEELYHAVQNKNWDTSYSTLLHFPHPALKAVRGGDELAKNTVKTIRDMVKDTLKELLKYCFTCTEAEFIQDRQKMAPYVKILVEACQNYEQKYYAAKLEEKVLDFSDYEHLALSLLIRPDGTPTEESLRISSRYDAVMVDEYQDTNELQSALYESLGNPQGSNLFYVGDVKQSIYRFRKANPGIFLDKKHSWVPYGEGEGNAVITLGHNFRSGQGVIQGVNYLFFQLMSNQLGEVDYTAPGELLIQGSEGGEEKGFEVRVLDDPDGIGDAGYVAQRIEDMIQEGYLVRDGNNLRPCQYGDFAILLRAKSHTGDYLLALESRGIPAVSDLADEMLITPEILPVTAALTAIDNPGDDVAIAAALLGPLFHFTPSQVTQLRAQQPKGSLWGALLKSDHPRAQDFVKSISFYRAFAGEAPVGRLCEELVERTGYLSAVAAMEDGLARRENLMRFLGWAGEISAGSRGGLSSFIAMVQNGKGPQASGFKYLKGHVSILTIHKSKGLEFPVCFLADSTHTFNRMDLTARVQMHTGLGIGLTLQTKGRLYPTLPALAIRRRTERETLSEEMRVLYVALTRAKDKMIVVVPSKKAEAYIQGKSAEAALCGENTYLLSRGRSMADWVVTAALCHSDSAPLHAFAGLGHPPHGPEGPFIMTVEKPQTSIGEEEAEFQLTAPEDLALTGQIMKGFSVPMPRSPLAALPAKVSVSSLSKPTLSSLRKRPSFMYQSGLTAAERGSAQHNFLQFANFASAKSNLEEEILRLTDEGILDQQVSNNLDRQGILTFLSSPVAKRMEQAKQLLREYDFITAIPASIIDPTLPPSLAGETVLVQGIADGVLVGETQLEIVDYKTDRGKTPEQLVDLYANQLRLYRAAVEKRFEMPVTKLTIWSFHLGAEVDIPLT